MGTDCNGATVGCYSCYHYWIVCGTFVVHNVKTTQKQKLKLRPGDGIGIRVGLRSQIFGVRVSAWAPIICLVNSAVECLPYKEKVGSSILSQGTIDK